MKSLRLLFIAYKVDKLDFGQVRAAAVGKATVDMIKQATGVQTLTNLASAR